MSDDRITLNGEDAEIEHHPERGEFALTIWQEDELGGTVYVELESDLVERIIGGDF